MIFEPVACFAFFAVSLSPNVLNCIVAEMIFSTLYSILKINYILCNTLCVCVHMCVCADMPILLFTVFFFFQTEICAKKKKKKVI